MEDEVPYILDEQVRYYQDRAPEYDDVWYRRGPYDLGPEGNAAWFRETARLEAVVDALDVSGNVLELACGTGIFTRRLAPRTHRMIAVDAADRALEINRSSVGDPRIRYVHADLFVWEPPHEERFDVIFFAFLVSHILPARSEEFWHRLKRWLLPGGYVFFCDDIAGAQARQSNPGEDARDGRGFTHRRRLTDGREYTIVKVFHEPDELRTSLASLGWKAKIERTGREFFHGVARPTH